MVRVVRNPEVRYIVENVDVTTFGGAAMQYVQVVARGEDGAEAQAAYERAMAERQAHLEAAVLRAYDLLVSHLTPAQAKQFKREGVFDVQRTQRRGYADMADHPQYKIGYWGPGQYRAAFLHGRRQWLGLCVHGYSPGSGEPVLCGCGCGQVLSGSEERLPWPDEVLAYKLAIENDDQRFAGIPTSRIMDKPQPPVMPAIR